MFLEGAEELPVCVKRLVSVVLFDNHKIVAMPADMPFDAIEYFGKIAFGVVDTYFVV
jgi:hypothetical protein